MFAHKRGCIAAALRAGVWEDISLSYYLESEIMYSGLVLYLIPIRHGISVVYTIMIAQA